MSYFEDDGEDFILLTFERVKAETDAAWLLTFGMTNGLDDIDHWLPKSLCHIDKEEFTIEVPEWLAIEKEIEGYEV